MFFDKQGQRTEYAGIPWGSEVSALTGGDGGNVYYAAAAGVFSLDPDKRLGWHKSHGAWRVGMTPSPGPLALDTDGVLYGVGFDDKLRAIRAKDGGEIWSHSVPASYPDPAQVLGGAGSAVFVYSHTMGFAVYETKTGAHLGTFKVSEGHDFRGGLAGFCLGWKAGISFADTLALDSCGRRRGSFVEGTSGAIPSGIITEGDLLVTSALRTEGTSAPTPISLLSLYDANGQRRVGPLPVDGQPFAAGRDGTIYTILCKYAAKPTSRLVAYTPDLTELWHLDLGGYCASGHAVLDSDGVLYLVRAGEEGQKDLLAIQTCSPGLANSSWPSLRHDNRGTAWLH